MYLKKMKMIKIAPCKDCEDRELGCHSKCEKYIEYKKCSDLKKEEIIKESRIKSFKIDVEVKKRQR